MMDIVVSSKQELLDSITELLTVKSGDFAEQYSSVDYAKLIKDINNKKDIDIELPLDYITRDKLFNLIKLEHIFIDKISKFKVSLSSKHPMHISDSEFKATYKNNEFDYAFLDNHPGILNIDNLKNIPIDYEGLMAVPPTILEYKNFSKFNIHRVIHRPRFNGKLIYTRVIISNKCSLL